MCVQLCDPMDCNLSPLFMGFPRLLCPWDFPGKNTGVGCHFLLQGIFATQGSKPCLLHLLYWQVESLSLRHLSSLLYIVKFFSQPIFLLLNRSECKFSLFHISAIISTVRLSIFVSLMGTQRHLIVFNFHFLDH